jgi:DNA-binding response OmpR family regulator
LLGRDIITFNRSINRIMIANDNQESRNQLARALENMDFPVEVCVRASDVQAQLATGLVELIHINLPMSGLDDCKLLQNVRDLQPNVLIVVRHSNPTVASSVTAVKVSASDYLIGQPDTDEDVQAVLTALGERTEQVNRLTTHIVRSIEAFLLNGSIDHMKNADDADEAIQSVLIVGDLKLDQPARTLSCVDEPERLIRLTKGEAQILAALMNHPDRPMSCQAILQQAWGYDVIDVEAKSVVRPYVSRLRHKVSNAGLNPQMIRTVRGLGYVFAFGSGNL